MNSSTATRAAEIAFARAADEKISAAYELYFDAAAKVAQKRLELKKATKAAMQFTGRNRDYYEKKVHELTAEIAAETPAVNDLRSAAYALDAELYKGWSRFFLVKHIHSSMSCSSFRPTTRVGWLPDVSGLTEAEAVATHGETLCTICYPSAPTELTTKAADPTICTGTRNYDAPSRTGFYSGNWATCTCGERVTVTSAGNLRKHKA